MTGLRVWTRPEIATTAVRLARNLAPHHHRCRCTPCTTVRVARGVIQHAAMPHGRPTDSTSDRGDAPS